MAPRSLRHRLTLCAIAYTLLLSLTVAAHGTFIDERVTVIIVVVFGLLAVYGIGLLVRPLTTLARSIDELLPNRGGSAIILQPDAPEEARAIANCVNALLARNEGFVERERKFIDMASHELRTPIAVLIGVAEIALDQQHSNRSTALHLKRIIDTAREMQDLVALLLILARDPDRLRSMMEAVELNELVADVIRDHHLLAESKELQFETRTEGPCAIATPRRILAAAIGNLVRNAIENSEHGTIRIHVGAHRIAVEDPGHGMSEQERAHLYTQLVRSGFTSKGGIGLELISRAATHLGWHLDLAPCLGQGTRATLTFRNIP